jgi:hypothetical protein
MQNKKLIALIILSIGAVISLIYGITTPSKIRRDIARESNVVVSRSDEGAGTAVGRVIYTKRYREKTTFRSWGRNPFIEKGSPAAQDTPRLTLNGIVWDKESPTAIINGEIVGVGDKIGKITVVSIRKTTVTLNDGVKNFRLRIEED